MQSYGATQSLDTFRRDMRNRRGMCLALGEDDDRFDPIAEAAGRQLILIDGKRTELQRAEDILSDSRALEKARRLMAKRVYDDIRRRLSVEASDTYRLVLPVAPSRVGSAGIKRGITIIDRGVVALKLETTPEIIRTAHVPRLEQELARLRAADVAEDEVSASLSALRLAVALFKAELEKERQLQWAELVKIVGKRDADAFFLSTSSDDDDEEQEQEQEESPVASGS